MNPPTGPLTQFDVLVLGGGAAGLMCAITAGRRGRSVLLLEHQERLGKKILISGGGRCNFTNLNAGPENYASSNPHYCKSALARYRPAEFIAMVERHGIAYHEKKLGQLFCDVSSRQIVELLEREARLAGVEIRLDCRVTVVENSAAGFSATTNQGQFTAESLVVATGGLAAPKIGATDFGYQLARQFGHTIIPPRPGLVPFTWGPAERESFGPLSGISIPVTVSANGTCFAEHLLFTHRGLSGPAILQISNYCEPGEAVVVDLFPDRSAAECLAAERATAKELRTVLAQHLPQRFAQEWCARHAPSRPMNRHTPAELARIAELLHHWEIRPAGTESYATAEVTKGGVDTRELTSKTMGSRLVPGLFFIGEVVDVTGWLGGYNFQWAWASGNAAGQFA